MQDYYHNELGQLRALIVNLHHDNVSITGQGTIDFSGHAFYALGEYNVPESKVPFTPEQVLECTHPIGERPAHCLFMHGSKNLTVRGITLLDSPCWTPTFSECENVKITGVTCIGENAIGIAATSGVIRDVTQRDIDFTRKPSENIALKGYTFDIAPGRVPVDVPVDCAVCIMNADVPLDNVRTGKWQVC